METIIKLKDGQVVRRSEGCRELAFNCISQYDFDMFSITFGSERVLDIAKFSTFLAEINQLCGTTINAQVSTTKGLFGETFYELTAYFDKTGFWYIAFWWVTAIQRCFTNGGRATTVEELLITYNACFSNGTMLATRDAWAHFKTYPDAWLKDAEQDEFSDGVANFWYDSFGGSYESYFDDPKYMEH